MFRNKSHNLRSRYLHAAVLCAATHFLEGAVERGNAQIGHIHGHLRNAVFIDVPPNGFCSFERARLHDGFPFGVFHDFSRQRVTLAHRSSFFSHVECYGVGATRGGRVEVEIDSDEEIACAHRRTARACHALIEGARSEVGRLGCITKFLG